VSNVVVTFDGGEERESRTDEPGNLIEVARPRRAEQRFQFGEREFNRVEVWTVGRQKAEVRARRFDGRPDLRLFVHRQVIEDDDVARAQRRDQHLLDVGQKAGIVDGPIEDGGRVQPIRPQAHDDGVGLPMPARRVIVEPHAAATPPIATEEIGRHAAFIEKNVVPHVAQRQPVPPSSSFSDDVGPPLLLGVDAFF
jgi:hypothetical protein